MQERNLFEEFHLEEYFWGDIFQVDLSGLTIFCKEARLALIDQQCRRKQLNPLGLNWNEVDFCTGQALLRNLLQFDIAYPTSRLMTDDKVESICQEILPAFYKENTYRYTNWQNSPWGIINGGNWLPLTNHTFDFGLVIMNQKQ